MDFLKRFSKKKNCADSLESPPKLKQDVKKENVPGNKKEVSVRRIVKNSTIDWM